jgi:hypothetical protein
MYYYIMGSLISSYNNISNRDHDAPAGIGSTRQTYGSIPAELSPGIQSSRIRSRVDKTGELMYPERNITKPNPPLHNMESYDQYHAAHNHD